MGFYQNRVLPKIIDLAMRNRELLNYRRRVLSAAEGRILEVGIGSGLNLPYYGSRVTEVVGLEPSARLIEMSRQSAQRCGSPVSFVEGSAEEIPLDRHSFDVIVSTWTLCSIPQVSKALSEMRRVMKPGGRFLFVEHGRSPDENVRKWQDRLTPMWKCIGGGCHLNRPIAELVAGAGFSIEHLHTEYMKGPKPLTFLYEGRATSR